MWGQKQELSGDGVLAVSSQRTSEAIEMLRSGIDQATRAMRDLTEASGDLAQRAGGMAKDLRKQSERAVSTVCPGVLFPYARAAVSQLVSQGGFPQFLLPPVNFDALYAANQAQPAVTN